MDNTDCNHCCDITDGDDPLDDVLRDKGCCTPIPVKRDCVAPVIPTPECDEADPVVIYDPDTEQFYVLTTIYDSNCSALIDSTGSSLLSLIA